MLHGIRGGWFHLLILTILISVPSAAFACDPCALFSASRLQAHKPGAFTVSVWEQYSHFDRGPQGQENSLRDGELVREFAVTQFSLGYDLSEALGFQVTLPIIYREFERISNYRTSRGDETGIGDLFLLGNYTVVNERDDRMAFLIGLTAGVKLPTGDTGSLGKVQTAVPDAGLEDDGDGDAADRKILKHHALVSASGGRALTLGTGSTDVLFGTNILTRFDRFLLLTNLQYTLRTKGDFGYEFADDFVWSSGPGAYVVLDDEYSVAARVAVSGEYKGNDRQYGKRVDESSISNLYVGPDLLATVSDDMTGELGIDFRASNPDSTAAVVPDWRIRFGVSYRF